MPGVDILCFFWSLFKDKSDMDFEKEVLAPPARVGSKHKQVIVWRQDLQGVPLGKKMAQAGHSAHLFLSEPIGRRAVKTPSGWTVTLDLSDSDMQWIVGNYRKVVVFVRSEEDLMVIYRKAQELSLHVQLVTDDGLTVFDRPTVTCLSVGPDEEEKIDLVTGEQGPLGKLRLL